MDTQLEDADNDGEWAVDRILSHHGSSTEATFEMLWKSGDVTWLPYYQITHLQALTDYLELLKVDKITKLPRGTGQPPQDDPQVFIRLLTTSVPSNSVFSFSSAFLSFLHSSLFILNTIVSLVCSPILSFFQPSFISPTIDLEFEHDMPHLHSVNHPHFT